MVVRTKTFSGGELGTKEERNEGDDANLSWTLRVALYMQLLLIFFLVLMRVFLTRFRM